MDIFEFELRYLAYKGLNRIFELGIEQKTILDLVKRTQKGQLVKKLTETTPDELKELTIQTYTQSKITYIDSTKNTKINNYTLSEYVERLEYELKVIKEMGYNTYFLIVQDYINRAKENKIAVGPGRGSAAGSLLSYLIGITDIDPLLYDLLFERFLNPARISMPDIDTDFEDTQREKVIEYCKNKYGIEKVASIGTYMSMAAKAAFKDVARVFGISFDKANKITTLITGKTIQKSIDENPEFKDLIEGDTEIKKIVDLAIKLEGTIRQTGVHACGVIISPQDVVKYSPIQYPPKTGGKGEKDEKYVTQYDGHYLEDIGLLKMDFLGLRNLSIIKDCVKILRAKYKKEGKQFPQILQKYLDTMSFQPNLDDLKTYEVIFQKGDTNGVFQFESDGMKNWLKSLKPNDINDIIAMVALYRPGPMEFIPHYIARKKGDEEISYLPDEEYEQIKAQYGEEVANQEREKLTKDLSPFMDITYGIPIYQEQLMRIVQAMAGFSLGEADLLRRGVGKKIKEVIEKLKIEFISKAENLKGYKEITSKYVYEKMIEPAADYSFNKSHAACYAVIAYQTAFLKAHYPVEFNAALLRSVEEDTDKLAKFIDELKLGGMKVLPPCVNESYAHVAAIDDFIRIGFCAIKGVGSEVAKTIEEEREKGGNFKNLEDFVKRCQKIINKKSVESLAKAGALDNLVDRLTALRNLDTILDYAKALAQNNQGGGLFDSFTINTNILLKDKTTTKLLDKLLLEFEVFKTFISAHPFDGLYRFIKSKYGFISMFKDVDDYGEFKIVGFVKEIRRTMGKGFFITIEDISGQVDIYLKEILDIKAFDIFIINGYKGKNIRLKSAIKINLEEFVEKAKTSGKYNEQETVLAVREMRNSAKLDAINNKYDSIDDQQDNAITDNINEEIIDTDSDETSENQVEIRDIQDTQIPEEETDFDDDIQEITEVKIKGPIEIKLPENVHKIRRIAEIIKQTQGGNIDVIIRGKEFKINEIEFKNIQELID